MNFRLLKPFSSCVRFPFQIPNPGTVKIGPLNLPCLCPLFGPITEHLCVFKFRFPSPCGRSSSSPCSYPDEQPFRFYHDQSDFRTRLGASVSWIYTPFWRYYHRYYPIHVPAYPTNSIPIVGKLPSLQLATIFVSESRFEKVEANLKTN